jgi:polysaccharide pyruvyl transferase WcaK-like protein
MKNLAKAILPTAVLKQAQALKNRRRLAEWERVARNADQRRATKAPRKGRILILPSDLESITGALGDDAMISATVAMCRKMDPEVEADLFCLEVAEPIVRKMGYTPVRIPPAGSLAAGFDRMFAGAPYDAFFILGADIMDGYYRKQVASRLLMAADLAARNGIPTTILGCSFNDKPALDLVEDYSRLSPAVALNIRDEISLERIRAFAPVKAQLVADSAFNLPPGQAPAKTVAWIDAQRSAGRTVVGVNVHPMLIKNASTAEVEKIITATTRALIRNSESGNLAWLMLPHDYRGHEGDAVCLAPIHEQLIKAGGIESHFLDGEHRAADLKALAGHLDGVITGRMHLAIASLGMDVPVFSLTYQDKFEGLYRHFDLPLSLQVPPAIFDEDEALAEKLKVFIADLPQLTQTVRACRPRVQDLARANYDTYYRALEKLAPAMT